MGVAVLGPLEVEGRTSGLSPRDRVVLSALVVGGGRPVSMDALADALWGDVPPASAAKIVQGCVVRLRRLMGAGCIGSVTGGYRLTLSDDELDHLRFERLVEQARRTLDGGDPARASYLVGEALALWRGRALVAVEHWEPGRAEAARLDGLRMEAEEVLVSAELGAGRAVAVVERARTLVCDAPFRERRWALLATALHHTGRRAEALEAVRRARDLLASELGLDPGAELVALETLLLREDPSLAPPVARVESAACPYRGLRAYGVEDADAFFGREDDVTACLRRVRDSRVLAVVGPSGIGKSSLVLAGVVASLVRAGSPVLVTSPGAHPLKSLTGLAARGRQTLVVDQAEEVITVCADAAERAGYLASLADHVRAGGRLVLTLRADHLGDLAPYPDVARLLEDGLHLLGPLDETQLRNAVERPARRAGLDLEPGLVDLLVRDVDGEPAALPLLSHVLRETWERREGPTLTVAGYRASGGIRDAVTRSAESLYDGLDADQRDGLRRLLLRLVVPGDGGDVLRTRVPRTDLTVDDAHALLVELLVGARLVSVDGDTVQIAHEALFRVWPRLRGWLDDDVDGQRLLRHLTGAADAWDAMGRPSSELYRGTRLDRTLEWRRTGAALSARESAFLTASADLSESELRSSRERVLRERRSSRRLRGALAGVGALTALAVVAGTLALRSSDRAEGDRDRARVAADLADARRAGAVALEHQDPSASLLLALSSLQVDPSVRAWDTLTSVLMRSPALLSLRDPRGMVVDLAASPDGGLVAVSRPEQGNGLLLLDASTLEPLPFADDIPSSGIAFSPDGDRLAMAVNQWAGNTGAGPRLDALPVRLYDLPDGTLADRQPGGFPAGAAVEYTLGFSSDGRRLVAAVDSYDRSARSWSTQSVATVWDLAAPSRPVFRARMPDYPILQLSPDGRRLYAAVTGSSHARPIRVYDVDSGRLLDAVETAPAHPAGYSAGALSPDGSTFAVATGSVVRRLDTASWRFRGRDLRGDDGDSLDRVTYSRDGTLIAAATGSGDLLVWDAGTGALTHRFEESGISGGLDFAADGRSVYSSGGGPVSAWDLTGARGLFSAGQAADRRAYTVSDPGPDGRTLLRERRGRAWFVDDRTGRRTRTTVRVSDHWRWSPDARRLLTWRIGRPLTVWDTRTGLPVARRRLSGAVAAVFGPSGDQVYVADAAQRLLHVLDGATLQAVRTPFELKRPARALVPHPDGSSVLVLTPQGGVEPVLLGPGSGAPAAPAAPDGTFPPGTFEVQVSPDGTRLLAPNLDADDAEVQLVDTTTWERVGTAWRRDEHRYATFDLSADGSQFAVLTEGRLALFDGRTGVPQGTLRLPEPSPGARVSYRPDGSGLLVTGLDGSTWTVDTSPASWVERACVIAGRNLTADEWREHFPHRDYEAACRQWPS